MVVVFFLRNSSPDKSIDALFGLLGLGIWLFILWGLLKLWLRRKVENRWPKTSGVITSKKVSVIENDRGYTSRYRVDFRYEITINTNLWSGEFHSKSTLEDACNADLKMIDVGRLVIVRYNPLNPEESLVWAKDNPDIPFKLEWN